MITLLDTNVLSELLRDEPSTAVMAWFAQARPDDLFVSAVTQAEIILGARMLPEGKRRTALTQALQDMFTHDFSGRILPFDTGAVAHFADIVADRRAAGRPISQFDAQIAAIARHAGARLATRNTADFERCGLSLVDPWTTPTD